MGIQYFYNFCIKDIDDTDLSSDILSAVRRSYFSDYEKIRDKITYNSEGESLQYDYSIERNKPLHWTVKQKDGTTVQEVLPTDDGKYYLCYYRDKKLFKRLLFSKLHTLLKAEYMDENGAVYRSVEPRKIQSGLCLLYKDNTTDPTPLYVAPEVFEKPVAEQLAASFTDYTAIASTNDGIVWFLSDEQIEHYRNFADRARKNIAQTIDQSYMQDSAPLYEKINPKDFNIKRNLSASLDISDAKPFGAQISAPVEDAADEAQSITLAQPEDETLFEKPVISADESSVQAVEDDSAEGEIRVEDSSAEAKIQVEDNSEEAEIQVEDNSAEANVQAEDEPPTLEVSVLEADEVAAEEPDQTIKPDKLIKADGAVYSYFGELDDHDNRDGYGRTVTELGRTAYEGVYRNDKRSGKGSYFYKDGTLCYSGDWDENVRHGIGVGISARDGSIHVGNWVNNKPEGNGVRVAADGTIKFVCKELSDGTTALMNYHDNDTIVISKYDKDGTKISDKIVSLTDE